MMFFKSKLNIILIIILISTILAAVIFLTNKKKESAIILPVDLKLRSDSLATLVTAHFRTSDSFRRKAAEFLLENFKYHYSEYGVKEKKYDKVINEYYDDHGALQEKMVDPKGKTFPKVLEERFYKGRAILEKELHSLREQGFPRSEVTFDAAELSDADLTSDLELSLKVFNMTSWKKNVSFDAFCNFILPYKIDKEHISNWRQYFLNSYFRNHDSSVFKLDLYSAANYVAHWLVERKHFYTVRWGKNDPGIPELPSDSYDKVPFGSCHNIANIGVGAMRALGIPAALDFAPNYLNINDGHFWDAIVLDSLHCIPFLVQSEKFGDYKEYKKESYLLTKVYRRTFAPVSNNHLFQKGYCAYLPPFLNDPFLKDVTPSYTETSNIEVAASEKIKDNTFCYLSVFSCPLWKPIGWGRVRNGKACFDQIGRGGIYLPSLIDETGMVPLSDPFLLKKDGTVHFFIPDKTNMRTVKLTRKFPPKAELFSNSIRMIGGKFQGANKSDFSDAVDLFVIKNEPGEHYNDIQVRENRQFRYVRYLSPLNSYGNIAELEFYENFLGEKPMKGKIIGTNGSWGNNPYETIKAVFDNNPLTYFNASQPDGAWMGLDLGSEKSIAKIRFFPRLAEYDMRMLNGKFQGANMADFSDAVNLYVIKDDPGQYFNEISIRESRQFRYVRYLSPDGGHCNVAEIEFYSNSLDDKSMQGKIIGTKGTVDEVTREAALIKNPLTFFDSPGTKKAAFDKDPLTFFDASEPNGAWVGLDLGVKKTIKKIRFLARNDMNSICLGNNYELFYWDGKWISLGRIKADSLFLIYHNVPGNSLLWLRNLTTGKDERIFTYEGNKQIWW